MNQFGSISVNDRILVIKHIRNDGTDFCKGMKRESDCNPPRDIGRESDFHSESEAKLPGFHSNHLIFIQRTTNFVDQHYSNIYLTSHTLLGK
jgi:hypothetical protein